MTSAKALGWSHNRHIGDPVRKLQGSNWHGKIVGFYSTENNPEGYVVESVYERGSVQAWPSAALVSWTPASDPRSATMTPLSEMLAQVKEQLENIAYPDGARLSASAMQKAARSAIGIIDAAKGSI
jgi:R67 dihydrofolate reductase